MTHICHTSFESASGKRYDKDEEIDLAEYKDLSIDDRTYFEPIQEDYLVPIEYAI